MNVPYPSFAQFNSMRATRDFRAIPWVFAWVQNRMVLPGWYGLGTALAWFAEQGKQQETLLQEMYQGWSFFRTVIDHAQHELLRAHLPTAHWYAERVQPRELGKRLFANVVREYETTKAWVLQIAKKKDLSEYAPVMRHVVEFRNPAVLPLNKLQIVAMNKIEQLADRPEEQRLWQEAVMLSIAGLAAAMQSTG